MFTPRSTAVVLLVIAISSATAQQPTRQQPSTQTTDTTVSSSALLQRLFDEDQAERQRWDGSKAEGVKLYQADVARRSQVRKMLEQGDLHSGQDFENAAFIFQHGDASDDYLLAHTLATIALAKGQASALWIATATLDRYLTKIGQSQIYGTQFNPASTGAWTQEPYNRALVADKLLPVLGVPLRAEQLKQLKARNSSK